MIVAQELEQHGDEYKLVNHLNTDAQEKENWQNVQQQGKGFIRENGQIVAREVECPVIALSQLSRETEKRNEKKPQLSDLRDSGAIEQDADTVILIFRGDYYGDNEQNPDTHSTAEIRVAKNRNGSTGTCKLTFQREITRFVGYQGEPGNP